jgi:AraC-like DNA-binding protein
VIIRTYYPEQVTRCRQIFAYELPNWYNLKMGFNRLQRDSFSPTISKIWQAFDIDHESYITGADGGWNIIFVKDLKFTDVLLCAPSCLPSLIHSMYGKEVLGIQFKVGTLIRTQPLNWNNNSIIKRTFDGREHFEYFGEKFEIPKYENVEQFIQKLMEDRILISDEVVINALAGEPVNYSRRTIERHFKVTTGMSFAYISQIIQAQKTTEALKSPHSLVQIASDFGYSDQSHMTRQIKRFMGYTPLQLSKLTN